MLDFLRLLLFFFYIKCVANEITAWLFKVNVMMKRNTIKHSARHLHKLSLSSTPPPLPSSSIVFVDM